MINLPEKKVESNTIAQAELTPLQAEYIEAARSYISYIKNVRRYSPHTVTSYKCNLNQFGEYVFTLEVNTLSEISHKMLRKYVMQLAEELYSPVSINHKIHTITSFFRHCMRMGLIKQNKAKLIFQLKTLSKLTVYLSEGEMDKIYTEVEFSKNFAGIRNKYVIDLFYSSGIRMSELIKLRDCDIEGDMMKVIQGKGNYDRYVPLPVKFLEHHKEYLEAKKRYCEKRKIKQSHEDHLVITTKFQKMYPMLISRIIIKYFSFVKDKEVTPH
ncbi:MAG TPA: tyrosine-type recombinase/integrase, partial [Cytophagaceae bacterium]|nr:tyrosine-type recombinase/integrase [Cytophagaceae bacterium]